MPAQIQLQHTTSGVTLYALIRNTNGQIWNGTSFGAYATASLSSYAILMSEQGVASAYYFVNFPTGITTSGRYGVVIKQR